MMFLKVHSSEDCVQYVDIWSTSSASWWDGLVFICWKNHWHSLY